MKERIGIAVLALLTGFTAGRSPEAEMVGVILITTAAAAAFWFAYIAHRASRQATHYADQAEALARRDREDSPYSWK